MTETQSYEADWSVPATMKKMSDEELAQFEEHLILKLMKKRGL